jgi:hypothetical protein
VNKKQKLEKKDLEVGISNSMAEAYEKALDSLGRYKFLMFGYWAAQWVKLNSLLPNPRPNPFCSLVKYAKEKSREIEDTPMIDLKVDLQSGMYHGKDGENGH